MTNAIIDENFAKNWDTTKNTEAKTCENMRKCTRLYPLRKEKQKPFVIIRLARNITLLQRKSSIFLCISAQRGLTPGKKEADKNV